MCFSLRFRFARAIAVTALLLLDAGGSAQAAERWFADDAPWNLEIKPEEQRAPFGVAPLAAVRAAGKSVILNTRTWTTMVVHADTKTPRYDVQNAGWTFHDVPVPPELFSAIDYLKSKGDTDRSLCIYDVPRKKFYAFWKADRLPGGEAGLDMKAGGVFSENGSGWWDNSLGPWAGHAAGASCCGGLVSAEELAAGEINHALSAGWPKFFVRSKDLPGASVYPARTTDGQGRNLETSLPMGTRLQLDPSLTVEQMKAMGLKAGDIVIARAMQKYGVYIVDSSETFAIYFVSDQGKPVYKDVTSPWPIEIMNYFHATEPLKPYAMAPLESRITQQDPTYKKQGNP